MSVLYVFLYFAFIMNNLNCDKILLVTSKFKIRNIEILFKDKDKYDNLKR